MGEVNNNLLHNFLQDNPQNIDLYNNWIKNGDEISLKRLNERFKDYIFEIYFCSYIVKSINYKALELKKRQTRISVKEELSLNVLEPGFNEEKVNLIVAPVMDFMEEIHQELKNIEFNQLIYNQEIIRAIKTLSAKQKTILFKYIVEDKEERVIAKELGVSVQAVNKNKNKALKSIRKKLGVV